MGLEKLDVRKSLQESRGDFIPIPDRVRLLGWRSQATKKGPADVVEFQLEDGLVVAVFADQLRKDGDKLLVSKANFEAQIVRAKKWAQNGDLPRK